MLKYDLIVKDTGIHNSNILLKKCINKSIQIIMRNIWLNYDDVLAF